MWVQNIHLEAHLNYTSWPVFMYLRDFRIILIISLGSVYTLQ